MATTTTKLVLGGGELFSGTGELPPHITAALTDLYDQRATAPHHPAADAMVAHARQQMILAARLAAWWERLGRWILTDSDLPLLLGRAARVAGACELAEAERWRDRLTFWLSQGDAGCGL